MNARVLIAGAGIGGLCLAHALQRHGFDVLVLERAQQLTAVGAGITMQANALTALRSIGLADEVTSAGQVISTASIRAANGRVLSTMPGALVERAVGAPSVAIPRAVLHEILLRAVGAAALRLGFSVASFEQDEGGVRVIADDGSRAEGSLLVGADGLRSRVRTQLFGDAEPRYAGYTSWRALVDAPGLVADGYTSESWGPGRRFGIVSLGAGQVYWFATANEPAHGHDPQDAEHAIATLAARFQGFHAPVAELIRRTERDKLVRTDIHDRDPLPSWSVGRVTLLGDAAHPMTPNLGQGGCQAIEDAVVLARVLREQAMPEAAFRAYETARLERANALVRRSRTLGEVAQWQGVVPRLLRDGALRLTPRSVTLEQMREVLTFQA